MVDVSLDPAILEREPDDVLRRMSALPAAIPVRWIETQSDGGLHLRPPGTDGSDFEVPLPQSPHPDVDPFHRILSLHGIAVRAVEQRVVWIPPPYRGGDFVRQLATTGLRALVSAIPATPTSERWLRAARGAVRVFGQAAHDQAPEPGSYDDVDALLTHPLWSAEARLALRHQLWRSAQSFPDEVARRVLARTPQIAHSAGRYAAAGASGPPRCVHVTAEWAVVADGCVDAFVRGVAGRGLG